MFNYIKIKELCIINLRNMFYSCTFALSKCVFPKNIHSQNRLQPLQNGWILCQRT